MPQFHRSGPTGYLHHLEIRQQPDKSVRGTLRSNQSCRRTPRTTGNSSTFLPSCVLLLVCEEEHRVYFYSFAKKSIVCTFTRLRRRASCVLLLVCEEEHRVYFYSFAKKSIVCTFTRLRRRASCVLLLVCEEEHRVYFYSFAKKSIVCTFTRLRRRASCVLLLVCEEEHRVYFYSFAKKSKNKTGGARPPVPLEERVRY
ncbi:hypothetical protein EDE15_4161 [Edaphobacter aggregans]|uniref:Uncharacterized protein n=1 Tax=Edaphobacter aggregans TaxID=570835 RepID=A0A428MNU4_9BACT|nr:hypothetical protein EDE15_4161 [Edaphobacter aggregans]